MRNEPLPLLLGLAAVLASLAGCQSQVKKPEPASAARPSGTTASSPAATATPALPEVTQPFKDKETGKTLVGYRKLQKMNFVKDGRLYNVVVNDPEGIPIIREDENYAYVEVPEAAKPTSKRAAAQAEAEQKPEYPVEEGQVVTPARSKKTWKFAEFSAGLPVTGQWRTNFDLYDMDADGRLEILSPPPRLSTMSPQVFKLSADATKWEAQKLEFEIPEGFRFGFGGVVAGDLDKDGKPDLVLGTHDGALTVAMNQGGGKFRLERRGLPTKMAAQGLALVDLDGDGDLDLVAQSETPEKLDMSDDQLNALMTGGAADETGYVKGFDARAFFWKDGNFVEDSKGLWSACWGYSIAVRPATPPAENPLYVSACRTVGFKMVLYYYDRAQKTFRVGGSAKELIENFATHQAGRWGIYKGRPAAFVSYLKSGSWPANVMISGDGITIYYQTEFGAWEKKRIQKRVSQWGKGLGSTGLDVGDLDGDGLDDVAYADESDGKIHIFFQTPEGEFEEMAPKLSPSFANSAGSLRIRDVDGDGVADVVLMYHTLTSHKTREGGFKYFRTLR